MIFNKFEFEQNILNTNPDSIICGVDEAGRGPWAGPVVAAAVILDFNNIPEGIDDSKKLNEKNRNVIAKLIKQSARAYYISIVNAEIIDKINILQATFKAMQDAVNGLNLTPNHVLIDGNRAPKLNMPTTTIIKGDALSLSIGAASILAKTARDEIMIKANLDYPQYGFDKHKGYGVLAHHQALKAHGPCPIHRKSFKPIKALII